MSIREFLQAGELIKYDGEGFMSFYGTVQRVRKATVILTTGEVVKVSKIVKVV